MTIGERIRFYRKQNKLTQKQLAEICGLAEITIRQYEANKYIPKIGNLQKISSALNLTVSELMELSEDNRWDEIGMDFPDAPIIDYGDNFTLSLFGTDEEAYIKQITISLNQLNLEGLLHTNSYVQKLVKNKLYLREPPTTE